MPGGPDSPIPVSDSEDEERRAEVSVVFATDPEDSDGELYDDGRAGATEGVFSDSEDSDDELHDETTGAGEMFSSDSEDYDDQPYGDGSAGAAYSRKRRGSHAASAPAKQILDVEASANQKALPVHKRGLLSDMIHAPDALGDPVNPGVQTTVGITATTGPVWARAFSNLRGSNADPYGADGPGVVPEDEYQSARFSPAFRKVVEWWHRLDKTRQLKEELAKISDTINWEGIPGIFSKKLKTVLTNGTKRAGVKKLLAAAGKDLGHSVELPTPVEISDIELERIMRDAIRRKVTSEQFKAQIRPGLVGDKLRYWIAEMPSRRGTSKWTLSKDFPRDFLRSRQGSA